MTDAHHDIDDPQAQQDAHDEGIPWMATDEYDAYSKACTAEDIEAVYVAMDHRRARLNEVDRARIARLEKDNEAIQAIFDRAELPLGLTDD